MKSSTNKQKQSRIDDLVTGGLGKTIANVHLSNLLA